MKIKSVTFVEDSTDYLDITVDGTHNFVLANGAVVHNCGTGVGFSCERQEVAHLPSIPEKLEEVEDTIVVGDSKEGWAKAFRKLISSLYNGEIPTFDYSKVRPSGARLKVFGGRASGPEPLKRLFTFCIDIFKRASGRKLNSLEVHDIMCMIGEIVVVGGVRRSALISLSNLSDQRMRDAKSGQWWVDNPQRGLANNSVAYTEKPDIEIFMEEWLSLIKSKSGERGIFNRVASQKQAARWGRRKKDLGYLTNPCSEIILRDKQLCNLSEVVIRADDTLEILMEKVEAATILGTLQSLLVDFKFVSEEWIRNTREERLLGVSLTGIFDHTVMSGQEGEEKLTQWLNALREHSRNINATWAETLGIEPSAAITCVKPSGTVSQLVNAASGIHHRHAQQYMRTVRIDKKDPIYTLLKDKGVYMEDDVMRPDSTAVIYFPQYAPEGCLDRHSMTALQHLNLWLIYQREWCEHKPSVTISVRSEEWAEVGAWVWKYFDEVSGISFLPMSDHTYQQAPYQDMSLDELKAWERSHPWPEVDWSELSAYEKEDQTVSSQTLACVGGVCEL